MAYKFTDNKITFACLSGFLVAAAVLLVGLGLCRIKHARATECLVLSMRFNMPLQRAKTLFVDVLTADTVKKLDRRCWQNENEWMAYSLHIDELRSQAFLYPISNDACELRVELSAQSKEMSGFAAVAYARAVQTIVDKTNEKAETEGLAQLRNRVRKLQKKIERSGSDGDVNARLADALSQLKTAQETIGKNAIIITHIQCPAVKK